MARIYTEYREHYKSVILDKASIQKAEPKVDYQHYLYFENERSSDKYFEGQKNGLIKLMNLVMEQELTEKQREAVLLVKGQNLKQYEAAEIMGVTPSTITRHLKAAQKKFDDALRFYECKPTYTDEFSN